MEKVENQIFKYRKAKGVTQEELAKYLGVSRQTVIAIEKGNYSPSICLALKLAYFFKQPVEKLFKLCQ